MDEIKRIVAARHCGHEWPEIHRALRPNDDTIGGVRGLYTRRDKKEYPKPLLPIPCPICFPDEEPSTRTTMESWQLQQELGIELPTLDDILMHAARGADLQHRLRPIYNDASRTIHTDKPIFLVHMADLHFGSPATDHLAFLDTVKLLKSDDRFYFLVAGADLETAFTWFRSAEAVLNQTIPPWMQLHAWKLFLDDMLPQCVAICGDNHSVERLERNLGDIDVLWRDDVPFFQSWGLIDLILDNGENRVNYQGMMSHRYKGNSIYHNLQPALRMMREYPEADWYVTAHTHRPGHLWGQFYEGQDPKHLMVCGTFKTGPDLFTMRNYIKRGVLGLPTLKLWPGKKQITWYPSPQMALEA